MKQVATIIKQLQNTSGTNDKINIVKANADNEILKKVLYYMMLDSKVALSHSSASASCF